MLHTVIIWTFYKFVQRLVTFFLLVRSLQEEAVLFMVKCTASEAILLGFNCRTAT